MARFYGEIGFGESVKIAPGVTDDVIVEYKYYGDVVSNSRRLEERSESVNDNIAVGNSITIVADAYAREHFFAMRYIRWQGVLWKIEEVTVERPRLRLRLGGVYNGPKAATPGSP